MKKLLRLIGVSGLLLVGIFFSMPIEAQQRSISVLNLTATGLLTVTGFGAHVFSASGTGPNYLQVRNPTAGAGNYAQAVASTDTSNVYFKNYSSTFTPSGTALASGGELSSDGAGGLSVAATHASGALRFYAGGTTQRWGINAAGDGTFGTSSHISDSSGTPTIASGFGTGSPSIVGRDYAFQVTIGATGSTTGTVNFGHTFTTAPVCVAIGNASFTVLQASIPTTTQVTFSYQGSVGGETIQVLCRGY